MFKRLLNRVEHQEHRAQCTDTTIQSKYISGHQFKIFCRDAEGN